MGSEQSMDPQERPYQGTELPVVHDMPRSRHKESWDRKPPIERRQLKHSYRMDSGGESDTSHTSTLSKQSDKPYYKGTGITKKGQGKSEGYANALQVEKMRKMSSSVPDISGLSGRKKKKGPSAGESGTDQVTFKKKIDRSRNSLMGSQLVFSSPHGESHDEMVNGRTSSSSSRSSTVESPVCTEEDKDKDNLVVQCEQMKQSLTQLQLGNQQILQRMEETERGKEDWICSISSKTSEIQKRLLRIGEKVTEDEKTLQQLTDLVTTIHQKFDELDNLIKTKYIKGDNLVVQIPTRGNNPEDCDKEASEDVTIPDIEISSLPGISKDRKGYKKRCTEKHSDNRRQMRKDKRTGKVSSHEGNVEEDQGSRSASIKSPTETSLPRVPEVKHETTPKMKSRYTSSSRDSRDDYRNLPVLASGDRVYASIPQETISNPGDFWQAIGVKEKEASVMSTLPQNKPAGSENYLVLDTSASMEGAAFTEMIQTAKNYINGLMENASQLTHENLCIVEVGQRAMTRVLVHMTNDRALLLSALDNLKPGGMSPLVSALVVVKELMEKENTNIVVISDGKMTPIHIRSGKDEPELYDEQLKVAVRVLGLWLQGVKSKVFFIPVGPYDSSQMEDLVKITEGEEVLPKNIQRVCNWTRNRIVAIKMVSDMREEKPGVLVEKEDIRQFMEQRISPGSLTPEEFVDLGKIAEKHASSNCGYAEFDPNMPPIGTRVRRGPDWRWDNQDCDMPGTVVSHAKDGHIWVEWDHGLTFRYRYGNSQSYDVVTTADSRIPEAGGIAVGCIVTRGAGWKHNNTDDGGPGKTGVVYKVDNDGTVMVRWSNGRFGSYKFGSRDSAEVKLCDPSHDREPVEASGGQLIPKESPHPPEDEIDPIVAEMNRKNEMMSKIPPKAEDKSSEIQQETSEHHRSGSKERREQRKKDREQKTKTKSKHEDKDTKAQSVLHLDDKEKPPSAESALAREESTSSTTETEITKPEHVESPGNGVWQCKDGYGGWKSYSSEHNTKLESTYCNNPKGVTLLKEGKSSYRILFSKRKQVNTKTKEMIDIRRVIPPS